MDADHHDNDQSQPSLDADGRLDANGKASVLGSLPRTRPQRASPRRSASQPKRAGAKAPSSRRPQAGVETGAQASASKAKPAAGKTKRKAAAKPRTSAPKAPPSLPTRPAAPKQGYEPEEELQTAKTVHPPSAAELAESVADIFVELASAGVKSGGRLLKDALSPLRRR